MTISKGRPVLSRFGILSATFMVALYVILLLSLVAVLGTAGVLYLRVRRQLRASDDALRQTLREVEEERRPTTIGQ